MEARKDEVYSLVLQDISVLDCAFTENAVYHSPCITKYLLKYTPLKSECMGNEGLYSSEHDTAFKSLISDIDEDLTIHKNAFLMTHLLNKYLSYLLDHIPKTYPVTKLQDKIEH